ncbi:hypothetical protein ACFY4B_27500 [Kitasatospora sp. NPDC001261]|uniref:hypothetical protein n=1 Tax=Kitasatospora sp. NPDC001261 TaxID=3364012 RepID=UPI0036898DB5
MTTVNAHPPYYAVTFHTAIGGGSGRYTAVEDPASLAQTLAITTPPAGPLRIFDRDGRTPQVSVVPLDLAWRTATAEEVHQAVADLAGTSWWHSRPGYHSLHQSRFTGESIAEMVTILAAEGAPVALGGHAIGVTVNGEPCVYLPHHPPAAWERAEHAPDTAQPGPVTAVLTLAGFRRATDDDPADFTAIDATAAGRPGCVLLTATGSDWFTTSSNMASALERDDYTTEETEHPETLLVRTATPAELAEHRRRDGTGAAPAWLPTAQLRLPHQGGR